LIDTASNVPIFAAIRLNPCGGATDCPVVIHVVASEQAICITSDAAKVIVFGLDARTHVL